MTYINGVVREGVSGKETICAYVAEEGTGTGPVLRPEDAEREAPSLPVERP